MSPASGGGFGRSSAIMAAGTAVSRVLGLVRAIVLAAAIGVNTQAAQAFDIGNKAPNFLFALIGGGVLNAVLMPQIVRAQRRPDGSEYVNRLLTLAGTVMLGLTLLLTAGASVVVMLYTPTWTGELRALAVAFGFWCIPQLFFYGLYALLGQVLNARGQFGPYMWAPVLNNIISIAGFGLYIALFGRYLTGEGGGGLDAGAWDAGRIALVGGTATLGVAAQALVLIVPLWRSGFRWAPRFGVRGVGLRSAGRVAVWTFAAVVLDQLAMLVVTNVATAADPSGASIGVASNSAYTYAQMIYLLPHSVVTVSIATALFTRISHAAAAGDLAGAREALSLGARTVGVFSVFAAFGLAVLAVPVTRLVLVGNTAAEVTSVSEVLVAMVAGLVPLGLMLLMKWVYYAFEDGRTVFMLQVVIDLVLGGVAVAGTLVLPARWWVVGIGVAMAVSNVVGVTLRWAGLSRRLRGMDTARILRLYARCAVGGAAAAAAGWVLLRVFGDVGAGGPGRALAACLVVGSAMALAYVGLLRAMRVTELDAVLVPALTRLRRLTRRG